jgi:hypothetical protein
VLAGVFVDVTLGDMRERVGVDRRLFLRLRIVATGDLSDQLAGTLAGSVGADGMHRSNPVPARVTMAAVDEVPAAGAARLDGQGEIGGGVPKNLPLRCRLDPAQRAGCQIQSVGRFSHLGPI